MTLMHVVIGIEGEYSDRTEYVAGVFTDIEVARKLIIEKTAEGRERARLRDQWLARRIELLHRLKAEKLAAVDEKILAYYGKDFLPSKYTTPSEEEQDQMDRQVGPLPDCIEYDDYYVISAPIDKWGRWEENSDDVQISA